MELQTVDESEYTSIFGINPNAVKPELKESGFSGNGDESSMFNPPKKVEPKDDTIKVLSEEEKAKAIADAAPVENENSLFDNKNQNPIKDFTGIKSIFEELIKNNQLLPLEDEKLETADDVKALIFANVTHQVEQIKADDKNAWYASISPAWQVVAQFAEKAQHPSELIPFIQSVQTIDKVSELDATDEEDAEKIVRMALISRNESQDIIDETISTYKENKKLTTLAEKYQPSLIQNEQIKMENLAKQKEQEDINNFKMIEQIHQDAVKVLETPFLGKHKLKKEEKAAIYNMIAAPDEQSGGYKIFSAIDNLYETKDFEKLRKIALILQDEKAYNQYIGFDSVNLSAQDIMRKVKTTATGNASAAAYEEPTPVKANALPRGFGNKDSGFGYFTK